MNQAIMPPAAPAAETDAPVAEISTQATVSTAAPDAPYAPTIRPAYDGRAGRLGGIVLGNSLLGLVTLGLYRFWGTTRLRRYIWSRIRLWDDSFIYTGCGMELFVGFLLATLFLMPVFLAFAVLQLLSAQAGTTAEAAINIGFYVVLYFLLGIALYRARRYRLSRTTWRAIRAAQTGSSVRYGTLWLGYALLSLITLGLAAPVRAVRLHSYIMRNTWFGNRHFDFDGRAGDLFGRWLACWALAIPTLGLSLLWFSAYRTRYFAERTAFENLRFSLPVSFGDLFGILLPYLLVSLALLALLVYASPLPDLYAAMSETAQTGRPADPEKLRQLDMLLPFAITMAVVVTTVLPVLAAIMITHRSLALYSRRLTIIGTPDFAAIAQSAHLAPQTGEGLADALDAGGGL